MSRSIQESAEAFRKSISASSIGDVNFPTSLDASRRVLKAVDNPDIGLGALAKIVVAEPLLSAKVIRLANSVAFNPLNQTVRDVRQAVLRIGMEPIKALAMLLIMDQLRQAQKSSSCRGFSNLLWERSVHVAALAVVLARKLTRLSADEAMFAGIVHDLGRFYLLSKVSEFSELLDDQVVFAETINDLAPQASEMVLNALNLPSSVIDAVLASRCFSGELPPATLGDLLFVAKAVSPRQDPFLELDSRVVPVVDAAISLGMDQGTVAEVIAASGDEIYSIVVALES